MRSLDEKNIGMLNILTVVCPAVFIFAVSLQIELRWHGLLYPELALHGLVVLAFIFRVPMTWQQMSVASEAELKFPPTAELVNPTASHFGFLSCLFYFEAQVGSEVYHQNNLPCTS